MKNNLAYIDGEKCVLCRKCVTECPTHAIHELNFPPRRVKTGDKDKNEAKTVLKVKHPVQETPVVGTVKLTEKVKVEEKPVKKDDKNIEDK
jgi:formate hydrogenlyase subunit 6/NADH:ubiquinone oxidoreductase subunit I